LAGLETAKFTRGLVAFSPSKRSIRRSFAECGSPLHPPPIAFNVKVTAPSTVFARGLRNRAQFLLR